jgi:hypothetical protein
MRIFVSSLITGLGEERSLARRAIERLGHQAIMAEDFGARPSSPQVACLSELRSSDLIVLILGARYGAKQASGLSATHEEFREAQGRKPILTFIEDADPEPDQRALIDEASGWEPGLFRAPFSSPEQLEDRITAAIHRYELANATAPLDPDALRARALRLIPQSSSSYSSPRLNLALAAGPTQSILRPAEIEGLSLRDAIQQQALFGTPAIFDRRLGTDSRLEGNALVIFQEGRHGEHAAEIRLCESGDMFVQIPLDHPDQGMGMSVVIQESVEEGLAATLSTAAWLLNHIDPTERISHVAPAVRLMGGGALAWRSRHEHAASPNSVSMTTFGQEQQRDEPVLLTPPHLPRPALTINAARLIEDFVVLLRRRWRA